MVWRRINRSMVSNAVAWCNEVWYVTIQSSNVKYGIVCSLVKQSEDRLAGFCDTRPPLFHLWWRLPTEVMCREEARAGRRRVEEMKEGSWKGEILGGRRRIDRERGAEKRGLKGRRTERGREEWDRKKGNERERKNITHTHYIHSLSLTTFLIILTPSHSDSST